MKTVSVIISTDGRANGLAATLDSLRWLKYPSFEVCIVCGPTPDGSREIAEDYAKKGHAKVSYCGVRNLSASRNIGIALASGEIIAFIDDDAIPEPEWLVHLTAAYDDPKVKASGGKVYDHTGYTYQYLYARCDRLGNASLDLRQDIHHLNFPLSASFPYIQGTNSSFEREALVECGGFDEEYEFYLDETDLCCRFIDNGYLIRQLNDGSVHHKYMPSGIRNADKITIFKYPLIKNKIYFSIINNYNHWPLEKVISDAQLFIRAQKSDLEFHIAHGRLKPDILDNFDQQVEDAWRIGLSRGLSGRRRIRPSDFFSNPPDFLRFPCILLEGQKRTLVFLSQNYAPGPIDGIARYTCDISRSIASLGHIVHVISKSNTHNSVDFESGVWVHRISDKTQLAEYIPSGEIIPPGIWNHSRTVLEEIQRISSVRHIDLIEASSWDCEAIATLINGQTPVVTNIVTTLAHWLDTHDDLKNNPVWMCDFGTPMLSVERYLFEKSDMIIAASQAIAESIQSRYRVELDDGGRLQYCVHGMEDMRPLPRTIPTVLVGDAESGRVRVLFVGRLEIRKGIDVLLQSAAKLLDDDLDVEFWIAGDDTLVLHNGSTAKAWFFEKYDDRPELKSRVKFLGRVTQDELHWLYANCDIYTSPSRFESFGLIFVEAMMFAKPVVGTDTSGISEIVQDGVTGLLVRVGEVQPLTYALRQLATNQQQRLRLGEAGRKRFEQKFASINIAKRRLMLFESLYRKEFDISRISIPVNARNNDEGKIIPYREVVNLSIVDEQWIYIIFYKHAWSGIVKINVDGKLILESDLFHQTGQHSTIRVNVSGAKNVSISRSGRKNEAAHDDEVILYKVMAC